MTPSMVQNTDASVNQGTLGTDVSWNTTNVSRLRAPTPARARTTWEASPAPAAGATTDPRVSLSGTAWTRVTATRASVRKASWVKTATFLRRRFATTTLVHTAVRAGVAWTLFTARADPATPAVSVKRTSFWSL
ncbi:unnamed protein product [Leptidea sinapis]|uniref:Uncharacterized protein n=1 Tax=Leptidea sinapis TaxID=189913 RepID=A0A5E4PNA5_9NEOP|nr:unnamed protein product [Leptidea sinapis]